MTPEQQLIRAYTQATKRLRIQIRAALARDAIGTAAYRQAQLDAVVRQLRALGQRTPALALAASADPWMAAARAVDAATGIEGAAAFRFAGVHQRGAELLARNLTGRLLGAGELVGRRADDAFRRIGLEEVQQGVIAGDARREVSRRLERRLINDAVTDAVTGFIDARDRRWQLDVYAEMVARTTTREAVSQGTATRMRETGQQLITISAHGTRCEICRPYEGNTYALPGEGEVEGYEEIDQLPPFHPNCLHVATPARGNTERFLRALSAVGGASGTRAAR